MRNLHSGALVASLAVALAGCGGSARYAGTLTTEQGTCGGAGIGPDGKASATLLIQGADIQFVPSDGVTVLTGHADDAGHLLAQSVVPGADHKPFPQVFEGDRDGDKVTGRFASPRCRATVALTRR